MPPAGFEPAIPARDRQQANVLDGAVTGIGNVGSIDLRNLKWYGTEENNMGV
jgi:hypothetical protein